MSVLAGVEKRLEESEQRLTELIQHLERQASLEKSLDDAGRGLGEASSNLGELAASTKVALESLKSVVDALQETVGILARSNPAETAEAVAKIEQNLEASRQESRKAIDGVSSQVSAAKKEIESKIEENNPADALAEVTDAVNDIVGRQKKSHIQAMRIGYITLGALIAVLAIEVFRFF